MSEPSVTVPCSACQAAIEIPQSWLGKRRPCPKCHAWIQLPVSAPGATPAAAADTTTAPPMDPYANTVVSRPGLPPMSDTSTQAPAYPASTQPGAATPPGPLTFADRLKHVAGQPPASAPKTPGTSAVPPAGMRPRSSAEAAPAAGPVRPTAPRGTTRRNADGHLAADPDALTWDDDQTRGWDRENSHGDANQRPRRDRRLAEGAPPPTRGGGGLAIAGLVCGILTFVFCGITCAGAVMVGASASSTSGAAPAGAALAGGLMMIGAICGIPICSLLGLIFSGVALGTGTSRRPMAIIGVVLNAVFLVGFIGLMCAGMLKR